MSRNAASVFVTGGAGFIGRHVVQHLTQRGYKVRMLVHKHRQVGLDPRVDVQTGDLSKPETYSPALDGVTTVVHAALTEDLTREPQATLELQRMSARAGVRTFVHLSSIAVYGNPSCGIITEEAAPIPAADIYSRTKLAIEEALRSYQGVSELAILRLGCVYGPGGGWWSQGLLNQMQRGRLILVNGGSGTANLIHVADVAATVGLLLDRSNSAFEVYNLTDGMPVTWSRYYSALEKILGRTATVSMDAVEAREHGRKWLKPSIPRRVIRRLSGAPLIYPLDDHGIDCFISSAVYSNEKASKLLAFRPMHDLSTGIQTVARTFRDPAAALREPAVFVSAKQ